MKLTVNILCDTITLLNDAIRFNSGGDTHVLMELESARDFISGHGEDDEIETSYLQVVLSYLLAFRRDATESGMFFKVGELSGLIMRYEALAVTELADISPSHG